ncbi:MFS general substrate transporter [Mycena crocata]|nr:MFS general substrate transporter [Mycena crocata]
MTFPAVLVTAHGQPTSGTATPRSTKTHATVELTDQTNRLPFKKLLPIFLCLALCIMVSSLDSVIVATAIPTISSAFNAGSIVSWVPSAYLLTSTCFQPLYGRFSDIFGRKSALCLAMSIFMVGNLIAGFSKTIIQLIVFRGFAGAGGGGLISLAQIVISDIVSLRERGKYQGLVGGVVAIGYAVGPILGGALAQTVGWRWCFWVTIPISFFATCVVVFVLPLKPVAGELRSKLRAVDYLGTLLALVGCTLLMLPLVWGGVIFPWLSWVVLAPLISDVLVISIFCVWEWKGALLPIVPMHIFAHLTVTGVFLSMFVNGFVFFSTLYYLPQFFQVALGYDPLHAGLFLLPVLITQVIANSLSGFLVSRTGHYRTIIYLGFTIWSIACGLISTASPGLPKPVLVVYMILAGIGAGQTLQTSTVAAQASVASQDMSVVTAMRSFIRLLGGTLALPVASTLLNNKLRSAMTALGISSADIGKIIDKPLLLRSPAEIGLSQAAATDILYHGYIKGFSALFIMNAALGVFATLVSVTMIKHKDLSRGEDEGLDQKAIREGLEKKMSQRRTASLEGSGAVTPMDCGASTMSEMGGWAARAEDLEMARPAMQLWK